MAEVYPVGHRVPVRGQQLSIHLITLPIESTVFNIPRRRRNGHSASVHWLTSTFLIIPILIASISTFSAKSSGEGYQSHHLVLEERQSITGSSLHHHLFCREVHYFSLGLADRLRDGWIRRMTVQLAWGIAQEIVQIAVYLSQGGLEFMP